MGNENNKEKHPLMATSSGGLNEDKGSEIQEQEALYLQRAFKEMEKGLTVPSEEIFERICNRIVIEDQERPLGENVKKTQGPGARLFEWLRGLFSSPGLAWGLCGAQAIVFVFAFLVLNSGKPRFETMTYGQNSGHDHVFNVIFKKNVKFGDVVSFLQRHHMKIINGPLGKDLFVIEIEKKNDLERLKKSGILEFMGKAY